MHDLQQSTKINTHREEEYDLINHTKPIPPQVSPTKITRKTVLCQNLRGENGFKHTHTHRHTHTYTHERTLTHRHTHTHTHTHTQILIKYKYKYTRKDKKYTNTKIQTHTNTNITVGSLSQIGGVEK